MDRANLGEVNRTFISPCILSCTYIVNLLKYGVRDSSLRPHESSCAIHFMIIHRLTYCINYSQYNLIMHDSILLFFHFLSLFPISLSSTPLIHGLQQEQRRLQRFCRVITRTQARCRPNRRRPRRHRRRQTGDPSAQMASLSLDPSKCNRSWPRDAWLNSRPKWTRWLAS